MAQLTLNADRLTDLYEALIVAKDQYEDTAGSRLRPTNKWTLLLET